MKQNKYIRVTMPDGTKWDIACYIIANHRARYFAKRDTGKTEGDEYKLALEREFTYTMSSEDELMDWAENSMNWSDVKSEATCVYAPRMVYEKGWANGEKEIVERSTTPRCLPQS